jgi:hypothetical protein
LREPGPGLPGPFSFLADSAVPGDA